MDATLKGKSLPKRGMKIGLTTNSDIHLREQKVAIKDFSLSQDNAVLQGKGTVENFTNPQVTLALKIPECSPQSILKQIKTTLPLVQNKDACTLVSGNMLVKGNRDLIELTELTMLLDATTATGTVTIKDVQQKPAYEAAIHLNQLDLDRYSGKSAAKSPGIPVQLLDDLLLQLDLQLDSLKIGGAALSQVQIKLNGKDGVIQLAPLTANGYDGTIKLDTRLDVTGDVPQIQLKPRINKVKLKQLYQDMTGQEDVAGTAFLNADLTTSGLDLDDLLQHMNGTLRLEILNGNLKAFPVRQQIDTTLTAATAPPNEPPAQTTQDDKGTEFSQMTGTALIKEGILSNDDLTLTSETMQIHGGGTIDLTGRQVDFMLSVSVPLETPLNKNREPGESNALTVVPYKISGPYSALTQAADVTQFLPPEAAIPPPEEVPASVDIKDKEPVPEKNEAALFPDL